MSDQTFVAAIDQGTTSTRCLVFDRDGRLAAAAQQEHRQNFPQPGWVEHDAEEIWQVTQHVLGLATGRPEVRGRVAALGITNQRETTVLWDRDTGKPVAPAIVWQDTRTSSLLPALAAHAPLFRSRAGLPPATYFSGPKIRWLLDHHPGLRVRAERGEVLFGTMDSWLLWNLTGRHITDVTNASRTMLMDLRTLNWDAELLALIGVPAAMLPEIRPSAEIYGHTASGIPVAAALGDQQAALFGQTCFTAGEAKSTYGTGSFLLMNTGTSPVWSGNGLLTTVAYRIGETPARYALEGSIAVTGALVQWLRDNLGLISAAAEVETLARTVPDNGGCYFVPA
ncbi:MAG TPA: FGGY family carbohydrate kinase, partial [Streptosporangiaceae bacterium]|nr:FGGY family carbohydrate kinase [Streptosporangiaceae bacterium]